ncbi:hypothetical protein CKAN_00005100 [Cinnamomum micranthum f. kanehirae]|uniref:EF-hand domain-containing protein n=1 Tax=Cinnamomum micranthum f. kanehirae TaxID=337451 RepID=A0A443N002_9MAGN|nr:hypothetical protein CKAN_00005100 [Cinnamomum micranthum f. kanehirae]
MSVEVLDGSTIREFIEDDQAFNGWTDDRFAKLDIDHDGFLSYGEMMKELKSPRVLETHFGVDVVQLNSDDLALIYSALFLQFDHDRNGCVDIEEFRAETKQMMLAMANGLGFLPVQMVLEEDSLLKKAVERELAKVTA